MIGREQGRWQFQSPMVAGSVAIRSDWGTPGRAAYERGPLDFRCCANALPMTRAPRSPGRQRPHDDGGGCSLGLRHMRRALSGIAVKGLAALVVAVVRGSGKRAIRVRRSPKTALTLPILETIYRPQLTLLF
jgi:hypothetical protein